MELDTRQIVAQIVAFLIMFWVLKRYAFAPILRVMHERQQTIEEQFSQIDKQRKAAEKLLEEYQGKLQRIDAEARKKLYEEIAKGREISLEIQKTAREQADAILKKAEVGIQHEIAQAKIQLKNDIVDMVIATTENVLESRLDDAEKHNLLIEHFGNKAKLT